VLTSGGGWSKAFSPASIGPPRQGIFGRIRRTSDCISRATSCATSTGKVVGPKRPALRQAVRGGRTNLRATIVFERGASRWAGPGAPDSPLDERSNTPKRLIAAMVLVLLRQAPTRPASSTFDEEESPWKRGRRRGPGSPLATICSATLMKVRVGDTNDRRPSPGAPPGDWISSAGAGLVVFVSDLHVEAGNPHDQSRSIPPPSGPNQVTRAARDGSEPRSR